VVACQEVADCDQESSYLFIKVKHFDKESLLVKNVIFDSIKSINSDSLFFSSSDSIFFTSSDSTYFLEVNSSKESATYLFYSSLNVDSLSLTYDINLTIPFAECGPIINISNLSIATSTFDSTVLVNNLLNINIAENIEVYQ
jgi:hypothetical protein